MEMIFLRNVILIKNFLIIYIVIINLITFFYFGWDKLRAEFNKRRVSEKILWCCMLLGGSVGGLAGMYFFRHKTKKLSFQTVVAIIFMIQILLTIWWWN